MNTEWQTQYENLSQGQKDDFRRILNKLLAQTFITKKNSEQRRDYYFLERQQQLSVQYLELAGWELVAEPALGVYQVINKEGANRLQLRLLESIILLLVRLCYEERRREITLTENVVTRVRELQEKYAALQIRDKPIDEKSLKDGISLLKRFNLLDNLDRNLLDPETRLVIYPSILLAVRVDEIRQVCDKLLSYGNAPVELEETAAVGE